MQRSLALALVALAAGCSSEVGALEPGDEAPSQVSPGDASMPLRAVRDLTLRTRREKRVEGKPGWIASIDIGGDGTEAVLAATSSPGSLVVWRRAGGESERVETGDYPLRPTPLRRAGGAPLVAVASRAERNLVLFDLSRPSQPRVEREIALGDVPMVVVDGVLDESLGHEIFVITRGGRVVRVGVDGVSGEQQLASSWPRSALVLEDEKALVVGFQGNERLELYTSEPESRSLVHHAGRSLPATARDLLALDLDGDGDLELIAVGGEHEGWIFGLEGAALLADDVPPLRFDTTAIPLRLRALPGVGPRAWGVLTANGLELEIWDWIDGAPRRVDSSLAGQTPADFALCDADGDGRSEFWIANRDAQRVSVVRHSGGRLVRARSIDVGPFPNDIASGDLDGDGLDELFVITAKDNAITVLSRAEGRLRRNPRVHTGPSPRALVAGDVDGDGAMDLLWSERTARGTRLDVRLGDGKGGLHAPSGFEPVPLGVGARDLVLASFGDDARSFVIAADPDGRRLLWLALRRAGASLLPEHRGELSLPAPPQAIAALAKGGTPFALAVAMSTSATNSLVQILVPQVSSGAELTWRFMAETSVEGFALDVDAGDLDGDGRDDVVVLASQREGSLAGHVAPLLLRGDEFVHLGRLTTSLRPMRVLVRDIDEDGRAEIFVANPGSHDVNAWLAVATARGPTFRRLDDIGAGVGCISLAAVDVDGDGWLDLVVVDSANDGVSVILNESRARP